MNSDTRYRTLQLLKLRNGDDEEQSTPAPPEDQIEGSKTNPKGSAEGDSDEEIEFSEQTEKSIQTIIDEHNDEIKEKNMATWRRLRMSVAKKVVRRGFGAFSTSHRPNVSRVAWGLARLKAFAYLMKNDKPQDPKYITDNDLLPKEHPLYKED